MQPRHWSKWRTISSFMASPCGPPAPSVARSACPGSTPASLGTACWPRAPIAVAARSWAGSGPLPASAMSDPSHEAAGGEQAVGVELPLDPAHQLDGVAGRPPDVDGALELRRRLGDDQVAPAGGHPLPRLTDEPGQLLGVA